MLANKLRSLLTMLGVIIGIAAVIATVALGEGAQRSIENQLQSLGTDVLTIRPGQSMFGGVDRGGARLTVDDAEALLESPEHIVAAAPEMQSSLQIELGKENANLSVVGTWASYFDLNNFALATGRFFTDEEDRGRRRVAVLGALVGSRLGAGRGSLVGETILVRGVRFDVIGVLAEKGSQGFQNPDEAIYIPLGTAQYRVLGTDRIRSIAFQAQSEAELPKALAEADAVLRREHRLRAGEERDFSIRDQTALLSTFQETTRSLSFLLAGIALISLIVGGIGIMNIMLVSVSERTREIGLRKALGARRADVLMQFLIEALVLCLGGGALGVGVGVGSSFALQRFAGWNMSVSPQALVVAFAFAAIVGIFFGMWPARRAARLDPIEALRYE
jgi:putative ABC transport system permease protein